MPQDPNRRFEVARRRQKLREEALAYKGGRCQICGYNRSSAALDFHHLNPLEKDFAISSRMTSFEAIRKELDKCVLLCSNCHREVHDGWHPSYLEDDRDKTMGDLVDDGDLEEEFEDN